MSRKWFLILLPLFLVVLQTVNSNSELSYFSVNEANSKVEIAAKRVVVKLLLENSSAAEVSSKAYLKLLNTKDQTVAYVEKDLLVPSGQKDFEFTFNPTQDYKIDDMVWYRIQYRFTKEDPTTKEIINLSEGIISISEIAQNLFKLFIFKPKNQPKASTATILVQAQHPFTLKPVKGVKIQASVKNIDDDSLFAQIDGISDQNGYFKIPVDQSTNSDTYFFKVEIEARLADLVENIEEYIEFEDHLYGFVSTDKPIYQPGQTVHTRVLLFNNSSSVAADEEVYATVEDQERLLALKVKLKASRFGVAAFDYKIPENAKLGFYNIKVENEDNTISYATFKVSRYELPNFTVNVKLDRDYYLPNQNAEVKVDATYLFGKPVLKGHVQIVEEENYRWDVEKQKYVREEGESFEGEPDSNGIFTAKLNFENEYKDLLDQDYQKFQDLRYVAYFTDETTKKREERRFYVRISKEPIHVYMIDKHNSYNSQIPLEFYVSAFYPDGKPAQCTIDVYENLDFKIDYYKQLDTLKSISHRKIATVKTNQYGFAKIDKATLDTKDSNDKYTELSFVATSSNGQQGRFTEKFYLRENILQIKTSKTIHRTGEPLSVEINSDVTSSPVFVALVKENQILKAETIKLRSGKNKITFDYGQDMKGIIDVYAFASNLDSKPQGHYFGYGEEFVKSSVLYPQDRDLNMKSWFDKAVYKPGEDVEANFQVTSNGRAVDTVLGVSIIDKAVEERYRADYEMNHNFLSVYQSIYDQSLSGISLKQILKMNQEQAVKSDIDLLADIILNRYTGDLQPFESVKSKLFESDAKQLYLSQTSETLEYVKAALSSNFAKSFNYPKDRAGMVKLLANHGISFENIVDPWGSKFQTTFYRSGKNDCLSIHTNGPDKKIGTADDFVVSLFYWPFFAKIGNRVDKLAQDYLKTTGRFINDINTLKKELLKIGIDLNSLKDPWGRPYKIIFEIEKATSRIKFISSGSDEIFYTEQNPSYDDVEAWSSDIDYFFDTRKEIEKKIDDYALRLERLPQDDAELQNQVLGKDYYRLMKDPWGNICYVVFYKQIVDISRVDFGEVRHGTIVKQRLSLNSWGPDQKKATEDDFALAIFNKAFTDDSILKRDIEQKQTNNSRTGLAVNISDPSGAIIPGVEVKLIDPVDQAVGIAITNDEGVAYFIDIKPGEYIVETTAPGFAKLLVTNIRILPNKLNNISLTLSISSVAESVLVTTSQDQLLVKTTASSVSSKKEQKLENRPQPQISTPRLREDFPETLLWQPEIETDRNGLAKVKFKLADNITTWKVYTAASTIDGKIAVDEQEITAFQPFFIEHTPPQTLTQGDEIALPVIIRNYQNRDENVKVEMKLEDWFTLLEEQSKIAQVSANDSVKRDFLIRADKFVAAGKQRITAYGERDSDAIEKKVRVKPDGVERTETLNYLVSTINVSKNSSRLNLNIPFDVIKGSVKSELKIYPNLFAHSIDSIEGLVQRPYGCTEQLISSTYPNLLALKVIKATGKSNPSSEKALKYLLSGYEKIIRNQVPSGKFVYWNFSSADSSAHASLTAYALRFMVEASEFIEVDQTAVEKAAEWLSKQQKEDGTWISDNFYYSRNVNHNLRVTAYISYILSTLKAHSPKIETSLERALNFLKTVNISDDPYTLACYALALKNSDRDNKEALNSLALLVEQVDGLTFWRSKLETPFFGYGMAANIETTALAATALLDSDSDLDREFANGAILFILRRKDHYGVWMSTQTTINVLHLFNKAFFQQTIKKGVDKIDIVINDSEKLQVEFKEDDVTPVYIDISRLVSPGSNSIEVVSSTTRKASIQAIANYYQPWDKADLNRLSKIDFQVSFDKLEAKEGEDITCKVDVGKSTSSYTMMLAEIGLPPGVEVDKESIKRDDGAYGISSYEILPDRLIVYFWAYKNATTFKFKFRPKYKMKAKSASSQVYNYYNPEESATVAPSLFVIK